MSKAFTHTKSPAHCAPGFRLLSIKLNSSLHVVQPVAAYGRYELVDILMKDVINDDSAAVTLVTNGSSVVGRECIVKVLHGSCLSSYDDICLDITELSCYACIRLVPVLGISISLGSTGCLENIAYNCGSRRKLSCAAAIVHCRTYCVTLNEYSVEYALNGSELRLLGYEERCNES